MSNIQFLVPTFTHMLTALSGWLQKAQDQMPEAEAEALLSARLAPDMFPLATQVRFACVQAQEAAFRLTGQDFPESLETLLDEARHAGEHPGTLRDAQVRIAETLVLLKGLAPDALGADPARPIVHTLGNGMVFDFSAEQYAVDWALAQFNFHLMIAYAILRSEKVKIGKADYIPHILPYLRTEAVTPSLT